MIINIRKETENDCNDIKSVNDKAFGQENEGKLVKNLRKNEKYISDLSLIAEVDNKIVGHILFFPIKVISQENEYETLSLAPMSVLPNYQKMGIGSKLIEYGIKAAKKAGYTSIIVLGHPDFYPRFGFVPASTFGIKPPFEVPDNAFMALELLPNSLKGKQGTVKYPKEYNAGIDCEDLL